MQEKLNFTGFLNNHNNKYIFSFGVFYLLFIWTLCVFLMIISCLLFQLQQKNNDISKLWTSPELKNWANQIVLKATPTFVDSGKRSYCCKELDKCESPARLWHNKGTRRKKNKTVLFWLSSQRHHETNRLCFISLYVIQATARCQPIYDTGVNQV